MAPFIYDDGPYVPSTGGAERYSIEGDKTLPIAIVGMSCRFPGDATDVEKLWKMCAESRDAWSTIPEDRFNLNGYYHPDSSRPGTTYVRGGHFLTDNPAHFDAPFFNITREEAASMDPQQRLVLECSYEALENAGITMRQIIGSDTSVFMGSFCRDWTDILNRDIEALPFYQATGTGQALLANRLSYFYDLKGPSISIDTACSSSLVALHLACQSLRTGESKQAIVGGSNVILSHETMISMSRMRFLSPDGRCYAYDHRANGYSRGEGAACIVLKPLAEALKHGDTIRGVIRNTGTNQDGRTNGITLPSSEAQEALMRKVYEAAGLDPAQTGYVEAHGTGTPAGDPLEASALSKVFGAGRSSSGPLFVGSIKTNIGHLEGASGLAGLIKTVLMLENNVILPNLNFEKANACIPLDEWNLKVPTNVQSWPSTGIRRASICNYGYGGSNAHVVIDDASGYLAARGLKGSHRNIPSTSASISQIHFASTSFPEDKKARLYVLSAFDEAAGKHQAERLASYLSERQSVINSEFLDDLVFTLAERRSSLPYKAALSASSMAQLIKSLSGDNIKYSKAIKAPSLGFVFTGQGAQWYAMGRELIAAYPVFRRSLTSASKYLKIFGASWSLLDELAKTAEESQLSLGYLSQPICTAVQIALVDLLASWNLKPASVTGHSSGEIAAAYAAGAISQEDALAIAYYRGLAGPAIKQLYPRRKGSMLAVGLSREQTRSLISELTSGKVVIACINSPSSVTVSGDDVAIEELLALLQARKTFARKLNVELAYHSHHMDCIANDYLEALSRIRIGRSPKAKFYSSVTGQRMDLCELGPSYWVTNMLSPVEFSDSLRTLCLDVGDERRELGAKFAVDVLIELGPHAALAGPIKQVLKADSELRNSSIRYHAALIRNKCAVETSLKLASQLFKGGCIINVDAVNNHSGKTGRKVLVDLPPYPWNHSNIYTAESRDSRVYRSRSRPRSDILGAPVQNSIPIEPRWRNYIRPAEIPWVRDHRIQADMVYPAGGFIAMAIEAASQYAMQSGIEVSGYNLRNISIGHALVIPEDEVETMFCLRPCSGDVQSPLETWHDFSVYSVTGTENWTEHCRGSISVQKQISLNEIDSQRLSDGEKSLNAKVVADAETTCSTDIDVGKMYNDLKRAGLHYGPTFAIMNQARAAPYQSVGKITINDTATVMPSGFQYPFVVHPGTLDGCIQVLFPGMAEAEGQIQDAIMPTHIDEIFVSSNISRSPGHEFRVYAKSGKTSVRQSVSSILAFNNDNADLEPMITFKGLTCSSLPKACAEEALPEAKKLCFKTLWAPSPDYLSSQQLRELSQYETLNGGHSPMAAYIDCLAHENPHLKCLEVNAQIGGITHSVLQVLRGSTGDVPRFTSYEVTNSQTELFENIKARLPESDKLITFKKFNVEMDALEQGFEQASYDLIITSYAGKGIHAVGKAMESVHKLLKPEGCLVVFGAFQDIDIPITSEHEWDCIMRLDGSLDHLETTMVVLKPVHKSAPRDLEVVIIADDITNNVLLSSLKASLDGLGATISVTTLLNAEPHGKSCIVLDELAHSILGDPSSVQFESVKRVLAESSDVLWITRGGMIESVSPDSNLISGLARTMRLENSSRIISLDMDMQTPLSVEKCAHVIAKVFWTNFKRDFDGQVRDMEYAERDGIIMIPRVVEEKSLNEYLSAATGGTMPENKQFSQPGRYLTADFGIPGDIGSLRYVDDIRMSQELAEDFVEIEVKASGLTSVDFMIATGRGKRTCLGRECSGIISAVGKTVSTLQVGDRVVCHARGTLSTSIRQHASCIQLLPATISFELGACLPIAYTTAYYALFQVANLEMNDTVLVNAAAGAVGQAVIRFCHMRGCEVFATVQSSDENSFLEEELKITQSHIFSSKSWAFVNRVKIMTGGEGVNIIINLDPSGVPGHISDCIAPFGKIVNVDTSSNITTPMGKHSKNTTIAALDFDELLAGRPEHVMKAFSKAMTLIHEGKIPLPSRFSTFGMSEVPTALRTTQAEKNIGSLVVMPRPNEMVRVIPQDTSQALLRADSSYLLVGGLGGLGRAIAMWMVKHGARHLIFASRSGLAKKSARLLVNDLEHKGAKCSVFNCDVSNSQQLDSLLAQSMETMPPIRGVIQAAMVIENSFFQNMTLDSYNASIRPKVKGTWNLHNSLPKSLDFFILLSSAVGTIGNASQAAYAAASTFQDAFASYRTCLGLPAISLDLGMINDIGYVAENHSVQQSLEKLGFEGVHEPELMAMLQSAITTPLRTPRSANIISGLGTYRQGEDLHPAFAEPRFSHFRRMGLHLARLTGTGPTGSETDIFHDSLRQALSVEDAAEKICEAIMQKMASLLMIPREEISATKPMADYGLDSLVAVQMRAWLTVAADAAVSLLELMANVEIRALAGVVAGRSRLVRKSG